MILSSIDSINFLKYYSFIFNYLSFAYFVYFVYDGFFYSFGVTTEKTGAIGWVIFLEGIWVVVVGAVSTGFEIKVLLPNGWVLSLGGWIGIGNVYIGFETEILAPNCRGLSSTFLVNYLITVSPAGLRGNETNLGPANKSDLVSELPAGFRNELVV